jgi:NADH:ubiquinone oxidoreductase subunit 2 (subunit N)
MIVSPLSNVPLGTADLLAYVMLILVAIFLVSGVLAAYYYLKRTKRMKETEPATPV